MSFSGKNSAGILFSTPSFFFFFKIARLCKSYTIYSTEQGADSSCQRPSGLGHFLPPRAQRQLHLRDRQQEQPGPRNPVPSGWRWCAAASSFWIFGLSTYENGTPPASDLTHWGCLWNLGEHLGNIFLA